MATLQVRSIENQLYEALGRRAARDNRSISQEVIAILKEHLSQPAQHSATEGFMELCGTWKDEKSAKEISRDIRKSRKSKTRFKEVF
ncbi:MAG: antitoxin [Desulfobulbaceae bacterium]|uniref:Antitoxin n=1 Tax=Candidatus Desulfobia pelagia TaxID=2841692 RepID=A0A8J6NCR9_9BACT|nr:antitoxin [Candidatus Desulfobia pelagia]